MLDGTTGLEGSSFFYSKKMGTQLSMDWHKTTSKSKQERVKELKKGKTQKELVKALFLDGVARTSFEAKRVLKMNLNSARRAISNLERDGYLKKLETGKIEEEGKFNHYYQKA